MSHEEHDRIPQAQPDWDEDDEIVHVSIRPSGSAPGKEKVFHTDENCRHIRNQTFEWPREGAEDWGLRECKDCSGERRKVSGGHDLNQKLHQIGNNVGNDDTTDQSVQEIAERYDDNGEKA